MAKREDVVISFGGDDSRFQRVAKRVMATGEKIGNGFRSIGAFVGRSLPGAIAAAASAMAAFGRQTAAAADELAKTADKIGLNVEALQRFRYAGSTVGAGANTVDSALQRFSRRVGEAAQGTGVLFKEFQRLGIQLRDAQGNMRSTEAILADYADAVAGAESAQEQLRLSVAAFDIEGAILVNLLRQGAEGMAELTGAADDLGQVLDESTVRHLEAMNQAWSDWADNIWGKVKNTFAEAVVWLDKAAGNVRTLEDIEQKLADTTLKLAEAQEDLANKSGRNARASRNRVKALQAELKTLQDLYDAEMKRQRQIDASAAAEAPEAPRTGRGKGGKPKQTYLEANLADYRAYRAGEITREEWLKRERARNPFIGAESEYASEFQAPAGAPAAGTYPAEAVGKAIADSVEREINSRVLKPQVDPTLVGSASSIEWVVADQSDKEGTHP
jgi:hypothetical protein